MCVTGALCCLALALLCAQAQRGDEPPSTTDVHAGRLAHVAANIELDRSAAGVEGGQIVITDHNLEAVAARGRLTAAPTAAWCSSTGTTKQTRDSSTKLADRRRMWRGRYRRQQVKVKAVEARLAALDRRLEALEDAAMSIGGSLRQWATARARLESARHERVELAERLGGERTELERIIREARREGAQPGWFR